MSVPLAAFSGQPRSYRNACIGVGFTGREAGGLDFIEQFRTLGAPLFFEVGRENVQLWSLGGTGAKPLGTPFPPERISAQFRRNKRKWTPEILGRVKRAAEITSDPQLELFSRGLLPSLEKFFSVELRTLLESAFHTTAHRFLEVHGQEPEVRSLFPFLFRFVTAKIFIDRADARGWNDLGTPRQIYKKAEDHSGSGLLGTMPREFLDRRILSTAWESISTNLNFQNLWVPDLAEIYESAFITKETRKELGDSQHSPRLGRVCCKSPSLGVPASRTPSSVRTV